jgi:glycosyl transferase, family 25
MDLHALVINLDSATERLHFQARQLAALGFTLERINAISGASISEAEYRSVMYQGQRPLARNEVACMMSHRLAWQAVVARNRPTLVLEDDVVLSQNLALFIQNLNPPPQMAIAYNLETRPEPKFIARNPTGEAIADHWLKQIFYDRGGAAAYVLTPQAAKLAIAQSKRAVTHADALLNHLAGATRYQVQPALGMQLQAIQASLAPETQVASQSTNARPKAAETSLSVWLRHPGMKIRRLKTNLVKIVNRISLSRTAENLSVEPCPTIISRIDQSAA